MKTHSIVGAGLLVFALTVLGVKCYAEEPKPAEPMPSQAAGVPNEPPSSATAHRAGHRVKNRTAHHRVARRHHKNTTDPQKEAQGTQPQVEKTQ